MKSMSSLQRPPSSMMNAAHSVRIPFNLRLATTTKPKRNVNLSFPHILHDTVQLPWSHGAGHRSLTV